MQQEEEFDVLRKDLEVKSNQIQHLKLQIEQHKSVVNNGDKPDIRSRLPTSSIYNNTPLLSGAPLFISTPPTTTATNGSQVENMIKQFHQQIEELQRKLKHTTDICIQQETKYQKSFQDMETKLRKAIHVRDELLQLRQSESNNQQKLINHLQQAMDSFDKHKTENLEKINDLTQQLEEKQKELNLLEEKNSSVGQNVQSIINVVNPSFRRLSLADFADISTDNLPKCIEKLLKENDKEKEELHSELEKKSKFIEENEKQWVQKLDAERNSSNTKLSDIESQLQCENERKQNEIEQLKSEINKLTNCINDKEILYNNTINSSKQEYNTNLKSYSEQIRKLQEDQDEMRKKCSSLEELNSNLESEKDKISREYIELTTNMCKVDSRVDDAKQNIQQLEQKNSQLMCDVNELQSTLHSLKNSSQLEMARLESELKITKEKNVDLINREKDLKEEFVCKTQDIEKTIRQEEKLKFENELKDVNETIENYKNVLQAAKYEIAEKTNTITQVENSLFTSQNTLRNCTTELNAVRKQLKHLENITEEKDNTVVSTLLNAENLKKEKQNLEHRRNELLNEIELQDQKFEDQSNKIIALEKEKIELIHTVEKNNFQSEFVKKEWDDIKNGLNDKNNDIKTLRKEMKILAKKLQEKTNNLSLCEQEVNKLATENKKIQDNFSKLEKNYSHMSKQCTEWQQSYENVVGEMDMLQLQLDEREQSKEEEVFSLLQKLRISEKDLHLLRKMLKNQKLSDAKALKIASTNQQVVTEQRAEIDQLKTKLQWMKGALEVSEATRGDLNKELLEKEKVIGKLKQKLRLTVEEKNDLKISLVETQDERRKLHHALEKTALKYADVYSLVEKQERFLANEREERFLANEREEALKYKEKGTSQDVDVNNQMNNLEGFRVQLKQQDYDQSKKIKIDSQVVNQSVESSNHQIVNETTEDLRSLLKDVKTLLSSTLKADHKKKISKPPSYSRESSNEKVIQQWSNRKVENSYDNIENTTDILTESLSKLDTPVASGKHTLMLEEYLKEHDNKSISLSNMIAPTVSQKALLFTSSPKDDQHSDILISDMSDQSTLQLSEINDGNSKVDERKKDMNDPLNRLQSKLTALKDIGEVLTTNNKELNEIMKKQSKRLRKTQQVQS